MFLINGRTYERFDNHLVPISGSGVHILDRGEFEVLGLLNKLGDTSRTREIVVSRIGLPTEQFERILELWKNAQ